MNNRRHLSACAGQNAQDAADQIDCLPSSRAHQGDSASAGPQLYGGREEGWRGRGGRTWSTLLSSLPLFFSLLPLLRAHKEAEARGMLLWNSGRGGGVAPPFSGTLPLSHDGRRAQRVRRLGRSSATPPRWVGGLLKNCVRLPLFANTPPAAGECWYSAPCLVCPSKSRRSRSGPAHLEPWSWVAACVCEHCATGTCLTAPDVGFLKETVDSTFSM